VELLETTRVADIGEGREKEEQSVEGYVIRVVQAQTILHQLNHHMMAEGILHHLL
jgi:hypothetical protein